MKCLDCDDGTFTLEIYSDYLRPDKTAQETVKVDGLMCYVCDACGAEYIFTNQIHHNHALYAAARRTYWDSRHHLE